MYLKNSSSDKTQGSGQMMSGGGPQMMGGGPQGGGGGGACANGQPRAMLMLNGERIEACGMPVPGEVTNVTDGSLTVEGSDGTKTFTITDATKVITKDGANTLSNITVGETVMIIPNEHDASQADYVLPPQGNAM